ncbi:TadE/TadG family type IV pilus assembly protein [Afifella pfennigii]|uniref:TadE/TadG family type IV pilus assembly protein n=1 Tax=Afifella pfennigii TaxID=209897 RepID=UPI001FE127E0|nr:TadE family protein [Afifella pfennigii]
MNMHSGLRIRLRRLRRDESGATALEMAVVGPAFIMMMMGAVEMGMLYAAESVLEHSTYVATRLGRTGFVEDESTRDETVKDMLRQKASVLLDPAKLNISSKAYQNFDDIGDPEPFVDANGNGVRDDGENYTDINGNGQWDADKGVAGYGASREIVVYTVTYPWTFFTPVIGSIFAENGTITLSARAIVQNEPF